MLIKFLLNGKEINLTSDDVVIKSNNFNVDKNGNMTCNNGKFTGGEISLGGNQSESTFKVTGNIGDWGTFRTCIYPHDITINEYQSDGETWSFIDAGVIESYGVRKGQIVLSGKDGSNTFLQSNQIVTPSLTQTSLESQKKNFQKLENALDIIKQVDIYKYNFKSEKDTDKKHLGFVIGDNYKYSKELTSKNNDGADIYSLASCCLQAIKEQQEIIENQNKNINELQEKIKRLEEK